MKRHKRLLMLVSILSVLGLVLTGDIVRAQGGPQSHLLFTFVTSQSGLDTGIVIANTTQDPFGTLPVNGACSFFLFGANATAPFTTPTINAGTQYSTIASVIAPNFQGYMIVDCNFPLAHGWYFHTKTGGVGFLATDSALVLPSTSRTSSLPESLAH